MSPTDPLGSPAEPLDGASLLAALQAWVQQALPMPSGHVAPECQWCPLCQLAAVLRGDHPEITERIAEAGAAVSSAVRLLIESAAARAGATPPTPAAERPAPRPRVQRIVLDDDPEG